MHAHTRDNQPRSFTFCPLAFGRHCPMIDDVVAVLYKWNGRKIDARKFNPRIMRAIVQKVGDVFLRVDRVELLSLQDRPDAVRS